MTCTEFHNLLKDIAERAEGNLEQGSSRTERKAIQEHCFSCENCTRFILACTFKRLAEEPDKAMERIKDGARLRQQDDEKWKTDPELPTPHKEKDDEAKGQSRID